MKIFEQSISPLRFIASLFAVALISVACTAYHGQQEGSIHSSGPISGLQNASAFFTLAPRSSIEITLHGQCKHIINLTKDTNAYIPMTPDTWPGFDSRKDQNARPVVEVKPCAAL